MSGFPPELIFEILLRLPPEDLLRCLCVSKAWNATIHDEHFIKSHLQHSIETNSFRTLLFTEFGRTKKPVDYFFSSPLYDNDTTDSRAVKIEHPLKNPEGCTLILGYANGLVCIYNNDPMRIALWNPSIQKFKMIHLPQPPPPEFTMKHHFGFGYDSVNDDYKILRIVEFLGNTSDCVYEVSVYSLKSNSWKSVQSMPCNGFLMHLTRIIFFNGALSWLMHNKFDTKQNIIMTFDLASEKYHRFPVLVANGVILALEILGDSLFICVNHDYQTDFWIMKVDGVTESCTLLFSIKQKTGLLGNVYCKPLVFSKNGERVLVVTDYNGLLWIDNSVHKWDKNIEISGLPQCFEATLCVGSICLLDGDSFVVGRHKQVPSTSKKRKNSSKNGSRSEHD